MMLAATAALVAFFAPHSSHAQQVRIPAAALENAGLVSDAELQAVLVDGERLETERRWGEALNHYEDALREYPGQADLKVRLDRSRIRYDLARRYADRSFLASLDQLALEDSLLLYDELLAKVNSYYVHAPDWRAMVLRGTTALEFALADERFAGVHLKNVTPQQIAAFRTELQRNLAWRPIRNAREASEAANIAARLAKARLDMNPNAVVMEYISGASGGLDNYSTFLTQAQLDDVFSQIEGNFVGLGIELKAEANALSIVDVIEGSPAEQAGMKAGDTITAVNGQTTEAISTDKAADMLKGPEGSSVDVTVLNAAGQSRVLRIARKRVEVPSVVDTEILDPQNGIAYLRITSFQKTTSRDLDAALWKLHRDGMQKLIIDVRGNPGGLLTASVEIVDKFVTDGTIVATRGRSPREDFDYKAHRVGTWRVPLYVLIDGDSASASEIFAGAIYDHRRGLVIGERSYGKGSVQGIFPLGIAKAGVRLTTAKFYSPSGRAISDQGVTPNLTVRAAAKPADDNTIADNDAVLAAALQSARGQVSQR